MNDQQRGTLAALADRQKALEGMFLAISSNLQKNKLVTYGEAGLDEVHMDVQ